MVAAVPAELLALEELPLLCRLLPRGLGEGLCAGLPAKMVGKLQMIVVLLAVLAIAGPLYLWLDYEQRREQRKRKKE